MDCYDIIIIGGGASGLSAGAELAMSGSASSMKIAIAEQAPRMGRKLLATGNGRCNLYNQNASAGHFVGSTPQDMEQALDSALRTDQPDFWQRLGLPIFYENGGLAYPRSEQAASVVDMLTAVCAGAGIELLCGCTVTSVKKNTVFRVRLSDGRTLQAGKLILAAGGKAAPKLSSDGLGYPLAEGLGHSVTRLSPGLVPVVCKNPSKTMKGMRAKCSVTLLQGEQALKTLPGEVQFTEYGVSGIVIMQLSLLMQPGKEYTLRLDLLPGYPEEMLLNLLKEKRDRHPGQKAEYLLQGFVKSQMCELLLRSCRIDCKKRLLGTLTDEELYSVCRRVKCWQLQTKDLLSWDHAQVTRGGVPISEIDPDTFESRIVPGLYLTGELMDAAGECGGFNLSWAFGSGIRAARSAIGIK